MLNCKQVVTWSTGTIGSPCRSEHVDTLQPLRAVHLREHLDDDSICHTRAIVPSLRRDRVELVKEQDAGLGGLCTLEELSDLPRTRMRGLYWEGQGEDVQISRSHQYTC